MNRVIVIGDYIADRFIHYTSTRRSPEADCPVVTDDKTLEFEGGAKNVYRNIQALGGDTQFYTWGSTTTKTRHIVDGKHAFRHDEQASIKTPITLNDWNNVDDLIKWSDVVVISDYGLDTFPTKDTLQNVIQLSRRHGKPVLVDPDKRKRDWSVYEGATLIKCNSAEFRAANNYNDFDLVITTGSQAARALRRSSTVSRIKHTDPKPSR